MLKYITERVLRLVPVLFVVASIVFLIMRLVPGDPAMLMLSGQGAVTPTMNQPPCGKTAGYGTTTTVAARQLPYLLVP
jgi:ABC-type dipeptide/oligopeptide/nickel transport system permease component